MARHRSYHGLLRRLRAVAQSGPTRIEALGEFQAGGHSYPLMAAHMGKPGSGKIGAMIAAGIHGDEPAGVEAALRFMEMNAANNALLSRFSFVVFPCNNPSGWVRNTRENADGIDLNRQFATKNPAPEVALIMRFLQGRCFDLVFEMHEDVDAPGFYLYEIADEPSEYMGEAIVRAVAELGFPIHPGSVIERRRAKGGIVRPRTVRLRKTRLPQAIYIHRTCGGHVLTMEPPALVLPLEDRVKIELLGLEIALESLSSRRK